MKLLPERHPNRDFFIPDIFDGIAVKDDMASMEHPFFTLSKKRDVRDILYENNGNSIRIVPSNYGLPTIFDKDILLYCSSLLMVEINKGTVPPRTLRISSHDLLISTNRMTNGNGYNLLKKALQRLTGVLITTNIKTNGRDQSAGFGIIDQYRIVESSRVKDRMVKLEITLSDWFYNSIVGKEVLTINRNYFRLRQPMERRIYEIARKHCGEQKMFKIALENLYKKTGSISPLKRFRFNVKKIVEKNVLPDYLMYLEERDVITFRKRKKKEILEPTLDSSIFLKTQTLEKAKEITIKAGTGWDFYALKSEFIEYNKGNKNIKNIDGLFIGFIKKKVAKIP